MGPYTRCPCRRSPTACRSVMCTSGLNDLGEVVGWSRADDPESTRAFIWTESEGMLDLNNLLGASGTGWTLDTPQGINNAGQILTSAWFNGQYRAALLTPVPEPS